MKKENNACHHCETETKPLKIGKNLKIAGSVFILIFIVSFLPAFSQLNESLLSYLKLMWWAILLGLLIGGIIDYFVPDGFIFKYLGQKKKKIHFLRCHRWIFNVCMLTWHSCNLYAIT